MAPGAVNTIRALLRILPAPLRERWAVRLFLTVRNHAEPAREREWRAQGTPVDVAGCCATSFGPETAPPALLLHGWAGRGLQLCAYIEPLRAAGYRVIAIDGPGHGQTESGRAGLPSFTRMMETAIETLDPEVIVAHSFGSTAGIAAAARTGWQGRLLCLGGPANTTEIFTRARAFMGLPESGRARFMAYLRRHFDGLPWQDLMDMEATAGNVQCQMHAVLAAGDPDVPPPESKRIVTAGRGRVDVMDHSSHRSVMWDPEAVAAGMAFLAPGQNGP